MTLKEAIRINILLKDLPILKDKPSFIACLNLNIEALKFRMRLEKTASILPYKLLPGETKD